MLDPSIIKAYSDPDQAKNLSNTGALKVGDRLTVKVLKAAAGSAIVAFGRFKALAQVDFAVKSGDLIQVMVTGRQAGQFRLHLIDSGPASVLPNSAIGTKTAQGAAGMDLIVPSAVRNFSEVALRAVAELPWPTHQEIAGLQGEVMKALLGSRSPMAGRHNPTEILSVLNRIVRTIEPLRLEGGPPGLAPEIKSHVENFGFFFEKKLETLIRKYWEPRGEDSLWKRPEIRLLVNEDLKPNLLKLQTYFNDLKNMMSGATGRRTQQASQLLEGLLENIQDQQARAVHMKSLADVRQESVYSAGYEQSAETARQDTIQVFTYQFNFQDDDRNGKLKIYYAPRKEKASQNGKRLSLLLSMGRIGDIRTDFFLFKDNLEITFFVQNEKVRSLVNEHFPRATSALEELFANLNFKVIVSSNKIASFETQDWIESSNKLIDYRV